MAARALAPPPPPPTQPPPGAWGNHPDWGAAASSPGLGAARHLTEAANVFHEAERTFGERMAAELEAARAAANQPGGGGKELQDARAALGGLEEAYYRERGDLETEVPEAVAAMVFQEQSPRLPSDEGSEDATESLEAP